MGLCESLPIANDATKIIPAEEIIQMSLNRIASTQGDNSKLAKIIFKAFLTFIALFDLASDWFQAGNYFNRYGTVEGNELRDRVFARCRESDYYDNPYNDARKASPEARITNTYIVYFIAASLGTVIQIARVFLIWASENALERHNLGWCKVKRCSNQCGCVNMKAINTMAKTNDENDKSIMEVLLLQLSLIFEDFPMTVANYNVAYDSCKGSGLDVVLLVSALGSLLSAFYVVCEYSLHLFFTVAPNCGGCLPKESRTKKMNIVLYPLIVLFMIAVFMSFGFVYMLAMGFMCCIGAEWCICCGKQEMVFMPLFLRALAMCFALLIFVMNGLLLYYEIVGNPQDPPFGYND